MPVKVKLRSRPATPSSPRVAAGPSGVTVAAIGVEALACIDPDAGWNR